jgi:hypothetical protein
MMALKNESNEIRVTDSNLFSTTVFPTLSRRSLNISAVSGILVPATEHGHFVAS